MIEKIKRNYTKNTLSGHKRCPWELKDRSPQVPQANPEGEEVYTFHNFCIKKKYMLHIFYQNIHV